MRMTSELGSNQCRKAEPQKYSALVVAVSQECAESWAAHQATAAYRVWHEPLGPTCPAQNILLQAP